jgi:hypothetical protein
MLNLKKFQKKFYWLLTLILVLSWLPCVQAAYQIETFAGTGVEGYSGDEGPAIKAQIRHARGLALDSAGNLYIADVENYVIRKINVDTGIITTVAGGGKLKFSDGILASVHPETLPFASALDSKTLIVWSPKLMRREYFWCFRMDTS